MDFGMIDYTGLTENDFVLKEMHQPYLPGNKNLHPEIYIGLTRWTYGENDKSKKNQVPKPGTLPYYAKHFNTIELNATHYAVPDADRINKWYIAAEREDFRFCPKLFKNITHFGSLDVQKVGLTKEFIKAVSGFKEKLGTSFIQLKEDISAKRKEPILAYLKMLPADFKLSLELRHPDWFENPDTIESFARELNAMGKGLVITDAPGRRDAVHMMLSNNTAFIRFNCRGDHELDLFRIEQWKKQLRSWFLQGLERCYFFLHIHEEDYEEDFIQYTKQELKY